MRLRSLPGYCALFLDYLEDTPSSRAFLPARPDRDALFSFASDTKDRKLPRARVSTLLAEQATEFQSGSLVMEKIRLLREPGTAVVLTSLPPSVLGGPLCLLLKCLTTVKLAAELGQSGIPAVPLALVQAANTAKAPRYSVTLLNSDCKPTRLSLDASAVWRLEDLQENVLGQADTGSDLIETLRSLTPPGASVTAASAALLARLLDQWGLVLLDVGRQEYRALAAEAIAVHGLDAERISSLLQEQSRKLKEAGYDTAPCAGSCHQDEDGFLDSLLAQSSMLPVAAVVAGSCDVHKYTLSLSLFQALGLPPPMLWPRVSATIVDAKSQKTLERYHLALEDLFAGKEELLRKVGLEDVERSGTEHFDRVMSAIDAGIGRLTSLAPEESLREEAKASLEKIIYQLGRLEERFASAIRLRREAALRQLERACNTLAPESRPQECELAVLHFVMRYSRMVLPRIYERISLWTPDHQVIDVE